MRERAIPNGRFIVTSYRPDRLAPLGQDHRTQNAWHRLIEKTLASDDRLADFLEDSE